MLRVEDLTVRYHGSEPLRKARCHFDVGLSAVVGPSGSGKSSLLRVLAGLQRPADGIVRLNGTDISMSTWRRPADPRCSMVFQDFRLIPRLTVEENIRVGAEARGNKIQHKDCIDLLQRVNLSHQLLGRFPASLSGGEQQRVAIARSLAANPVVLVADEPTGSLDEKNSDIVGHLLRDLSKSKKLIVVLATHDLNLASTADRLFQIKNRSVEAI